MTIIFNPTIEVATLRLRGWYMLGMFLLPTSTRLGHECQDVLSPCDGMHACSDWTSVYTLIRKRFRGMESEHMLSPREKAPLPEGSEQGGTHDAASRMTSSTTHYPLSCSGHICHSSGSRASQFWGSVLGLVGLVSVHCD